VCMRPEVVQVLYPLHHFVATPKCRRCKIKISRRLSSVPTSGETHTHTWTMMEPTSTAPLVAPPRRAPRHIHERRSTVYIYLYSIYILDTHMYNPRPLFLTRAP
jgi:hypothetical protein